MDDIPSMSYLKERGIPFRTASFPANTEKGAIAIAKALDVRLFIVVKTLIVRGASGKLFLCLTGGDSKLDFEKVKGVTGESDVCMASPPEILEKTGYMIGAIPPFALKNKIDAILDVSLRQERELYIGAGRFGNEIILTPEDLERATEGRYADIGKNQI